MSTDDNPEKTALEEELENGAAAEGEEEDSSPEGAAEEEEEQPGEGAPEGEEEIDESIPEKFRGKSAADIAKSYTELESQVERKALEKAQEILANGGVKPKKQEAEEEEDTLDLSEEEIAKMTPRQFAQWADKRITKKATEIAQKTINQSNETRDNVRREIRDATKEHPHLKTNKSYREMVLDKIEASQSRGKTLTLREACKAVDQAMDIKPGDSKKEGEEKIEKKQKPRTGVEKQEGTDAEPNKTDEDKVKEGMLNAAKSTGPLGGLGV